MKSFQLCEVAKNIQKSLFTCNCIHQERLDTLEIDVWKPQKKKYTDTYIYIPWSSSTLKTKGVRKPPFYGVNPLSMAWTTVGNMMLDPIAAIVVSRQAKWSAFIKYINFSSLYSYFGSQDSNSETCTNMLLKYVEFWYSMPFELDLVVLAMSLAWELHRAGLWKDPSTNVRCPEGLLSDESFVEGIPMKSIYSISFFMA